MQSKIHALDDIKTTEYFLHDPDFWSTCCCYFNTTRVLTAIMAPFNDSVWNDAVSDSIKLIHSKLNMAGTLIEQEGKLPGK
jgi:hypothetical protein